MSPKKYLQAKIRKFLGLTEINENLAVLLGSDLCRAAELRAAFSTAEFIEEHMPFAKPLDSPFAVLDYALARVPSDNRGIYCEFGVFQGNSINHIARQIKEVIYGFDSFRGLPEGWRDGFPKGGFSLEGKCLPSCEKNVELVPGWFDDTLPPFLDIHPEEVAFLHIDCDLYSSTKTVFDHVGRRLSSDAIIVFDEYFNYPGWKAHEHLAFKEFIQSSGRKFEYICYNRCKEQVAVQLQ